MVSLTKVNAPEETLTPEQWLSHFSTQLPEEEVCLLESALELAQAFYPEDAVTQMGEPMLSHVLSATYFVNELNIFTDAIAATILSALPVYCPDWKERVAKQ